MGSNAEPGSTVAGKDKPPMLADFTSTVICDAPREKGVPWVKIFDTGCLPDSGRVQSWEQCGVKILEIF